MLPAVIAAAFVIPAKYWLPPGINRYFTQGLTFVISVLLVIGLISLLLWRSPRALEEPYKKGQTAAENALVLLPLGPLVQYLILNHAILSWLDMGLLLVAFTIGFYVLIVGVSRVASRWGSRSVLFATTGALAYTFVNMPVLARAFTWHEVGELPVQMLFMLAVFCIALLLYRQDPKVLSFLCIGIFVATPLQALLMVYEQSQRKSVTHRQLLPGTLARKPGF
jgi:hypothetical protein